MQEEGADPDILETLMEDMEVLGRLQLVFKSDQEYPATAVQRERELACSSTTGNEVGRLVLLDCKEGTRRLRRNAYQTSKGSTWHGGERGTSRDRIDQGADGRVGGQHQASNRAEHANDDVQGEPYGNHH